jgi:hypothetical protein
MIYNFAGMPTFTINDYIDAFQGTKRAFTNATIKDEVLNKAANDYIAAQTGFAKVLTGNFLAITKQSWDSYAKTLFPKV